MGKSIYTYYKERLIEVGGSNKCLYLKNVVRRSAYDIGRIFEGRDDKAVELINFLFRDSKKYIINLISLDEGEEIYRNIESQGRLAKGASLEDVTASLDAEYLQKHERIRGIEMRKALEGETVRIKEMCREVSEIERDTGRYELYIGYPFVFGCIPQGSTKTLIKAPLLLFPVKVDVVDEYTVEISINRDEKVHINHALVYAYAQSKRLNVDALELEYDNIADSFKSVSEVVDYLRQSGIKITDTLPKNILNYSRFKEPETRSELSLRNAAVLGRFPLSNSIYSDYSVLEKRGLSNDALYELLRIGKPKRQSLWQIFAERRKKRNRDTGCYNVKMLDWAQSEVVRRVDECGNMVIYGPPGTGKSQTIVNVVTDAMAKGKKVLVVSQKKVALDVVHNRLGHLAERAMYITDESKEKHRFYDRCLTAHLSELEEAKVDLSAVEEEYRELQSKIASEVEKLDRIDATLNKKRMPFGLSLLEMYNSSYNIPKTSAEYTIYSDLVRHKEIMSLTYKELYEAMFGITEMKLGELYYDFMQSKEKNPLIDYMLPDLDIRTLSDVKSQLEGVQKKKKGLFNTAKYPYYRQVLAFYPQLGDEDALRRIVKLEASFAKPKLIERARLENEIKAKFLETQDAIEEFVAEYDCLNRVLTRDGYYAVIDNILRGNVSYIKLVYEALDNYISLRDVNSLLTSLDDAKLAILNFAYTSCKSRQNYNDILNKLITIRIYHEVLTYERDANEDIAMFMDFDNITSLVYKYKEAELEAAAKIVKGRSCRGYAEMFENAKNNKDFLYQISKKQKFWPVRKMVEVYGEFILSLFPCWLLSPENVSTLLPLVKNMFDIVIFDEASQVFIESTIPTIYRGKTVVVAGDDKQLRPSATFIKRYLGADPELQEDYSVQAALEVDSLLDLAVSRYESANLTYHYRSLSSELIDFSNTAFYSSNLQVAPNTTRNTKERPITRYKVPGKWIDRKNPVEAARVVELIKEILKTRKNNESIGVITFNAEQQSAIADAIDAECMRDTEFRTAYHKELKRTENGEDIGIFVKNLENVQGDERDIIIFSIGYAENEAGKVYANFGSLSASGGENRLNVAITRAKSKIMVVTSIEPEDLKVDGAKNLGPKLLRDYLAYVRAVSDDKPEDVAAILNGISDKEHAARLSARGGIKIAEEIKEKLEKLGYTADIALGGQKTRISLAVYDKARDRYLVGVELDTDAFKSSNAALERDVYKPRFLEARGWRIMRVFSRDWWISPTKVIKEITAAAEEVRKAK